jgi:hypothetical protein
VGVCEGRRVADEETWMLSACSGRNLMLPDDFKNLGFAEAEEAVPIPRHAGGATKSSRRDDGKKIT